MIFVDGLLPIGLGIALFVIGCLSGWNENGFKFFQSLFLWALGLALAFSPLYYEYPKFCEGRAQRVVAVSEDGSFGEVCPYGAFEYGGRRVFNVPDEMYAKGSVTPITENPKARHISYSVKVVIPEPQIFFKKTDERWHTNSGHGVENEVVKTTDFWLYEFNNSHSRELAELYNPLDERQVQKLRDMLLPWLNGRIAADGLAATNVSFSVE